MRTATIDEAKEHLEELIAAARSGEMVEITDEGTAVAELQPVTQLMQPAPNGAAKDPEGSGAIVVGTSPPPKLERFPAGSVSSGVLDTLLEERREGW
jgi:prevent-host-death family protein